MVDYVTPGYLEDLTDRVTKDAAIKQDDIGAVLPRFLQKLNGKTYTITLDGDFQMVYYRTDVLKEPGLQPPKTWDDYLAIAKAANGKDMNGDGKPDFGSCIAKKRNAQSYWFITRSPATSSRPRAPPRRLLRHRRHEAAGQQRGLRGRRCGSTTRPPIRPARRDQPRCRRHPQPVHLRPLRADDRLGRHRHAGDRPKTSRR